MTKCPLPRLTFGMCDSAGPNPGLGPLGKQGPAAGDVGVLGQTESLEPIGRPAFSGWKLGRAQSRKRVFLLPPGITN